MEIYDISEKTVRSVLPQLGVRAVTIPGIGWRIFGPDIEKLHWDALVPEVARLMQETVRTLRNHTKRRNAHATEGT